MSELPKLKATPIGTIVNASTGKQIAVLTKGGRSEKVVTAYARRFVACWNERDALEAKADCHDDLVAACEMAERAEKYFGPSDVGFKLKEEARKLRYAALEKVKVKNE